MSFDEQTTGAETRPFRLYQDFNLTVLQDVVTEILTTDAETGQLRPGTEPCFVCGMELSHGVRVVFDNGYPDQMSVGIYCMRHDEQAALGKARDVAIGMLAGRIAALSATNVSTVEIRAAT